MKFCKRFLPFVFLFCIFFASGTAPLVHAEELLPVMAASDEKAPQFTQELPAKSYILMEASTGQILVENNADQQMPPASITKIMTMLLLMERLDSEEIHLDDMVTASEHASSMGGTQIWLEPGEQMSVYDLLKATAVNSANDAAVALAEYLGGTEENFVSMMNQRAKELGMKNTVFKNASGLDADGHLSTARDIAIMSRELLKHPEITDFTSIYMDSLRNGETELVNTNKMVRFYEGCHGLKTGTTDGAGSCLSAAANRNGMELIAVTMGSATSKERFASARALLDYGFATYALYHPEISEEELQPVKIKNGQENTVNLTLGEENSLVMPKGSTSQIQHEIKLKEDIEAPVEKGDELGTVSYSLNGQIIAEQPIYAAETVKETNFSYIFIGLIKNLLGA